MSIYIGNDLEDRLKALEAENASLRKYNEYHQVVHEIDHMSDLCLSQFQLGTSPPGKIFLSERIPATRANFFV